MSGLSTPGATTEWTSIAGGNLRNALAPLLIPPREWGLGAKGKGERGRGRTIFNDEFKKLLKIIFTSFQILEFFHILRKILL
ncbi:MAG: hypothetical protein C4323_10875 [Mastigocladus sp. ERB_26_2]